ncbi:MAG: hypothetical protein ACK42D_04130 [Candidatus Paceibacteria bacterium]
MPRKINYTFDEVRKMLQWELQQKSDGSREAERQIKELCEALTDEVLEMSENVGLTDQNDLQDRVETYRKQTR